MCAKFHTSNVNKWIISLFVPDASQILLDRSRVKIRSRNQRRHAGLEDPSESNKTVGNITEQTGSPGIVCSPEFFKIPDGVLMLFRANAEEIVPGANQDW